MIKRISQILKYFKLTEGQLAKKVNIPQQTLNNYMLGRTKTIPLSLVESLLENFPDLSAEWLLRGNDPMLLSKAYEFGEESTKPSMVADDSKVYFQGAQYVTDIIMSQAEFKAVIAKKDSTIDELKEVIARNEKIIDRLLEK